MKATSAAARAGLMANFMWAETANERLEQIKRVTEATRPKDVGHKARRVEVKEEEQGREKPTRKGTWPGLTD